MVDPEDARLVEQLRAGDERAFTAVFDAHHPMLLRLARAIVKSDSAAEEIAQDTWAAAIAALGSFEGRSSLRTWLAKIAVNRAKTRAARDGRTESLDARADDGGGDDADKFYDFGPWRRSPTAWTETPEALLERRQAREAIDAALEALPDAQRVVVTLRDLEGWSSEEVCNALEIGESNQRVLLHRGRSRIRDVLARFFDGGSR